MPPFLPHSGRSNLHTYCDNRPMRLHGYAPRPAHLKWILYSDPAIRWQVMGDVAGAAPDVIAAERSRAATEGRGAQLLARRRACLHKRGLPGRMTARTAGPVTGAAIARHIAASYPQACSHVWPPPLRRPASTPSVRTRYSAGSLSAGRAGPRESESEWCSSCRTQHSEMR